MTVTMQQLNGKEDPLIADVCKQEARILVTLDLDFADIQTYPPRFYPGFIVLRPYWQDKWHLLALFQRVIPRLDHEVIDHTLWIVEETRIRVHGGDTE